MPSVHQHSASATDYDDEAAKLVATKDLSTLKALVRGMDDQDRVQRHIDALAAAEETRAPRTDAMGLLNRRLAALRARND